eukprot:4213872-Pyramimonas_sp.AAC.1
MWGKTSPSTLRRVELADEGWLRHAKLTHALSGNPSQSQHHRTLQLYPLTHSNQVWEGGRKSLLQLPSRCSTAVHHHLQLKQYMYVLKVGVYNCCAATTFRQYCQLC